MKTTPKFQVITGDATGVTPWLQFPERIRCKSHLNSGQMASVRVAGEFPLKSARAARRQPAFELWSCILKQPPPINNIGYAGNQPTHDGLSALEDAHACFQGLCRPIGEDDEAREWLTFVMKPAFFYRFDNNYPGALACVGRRLPVAQDLVFVAHVRLDYPCGEDEEAVLGALTHWSFCEAAANDSMLPSEYRSRFQSRLW